MSPAELRFIGSGDAFGSGGRFQTCLRLSGAGDPMLIDCGCRRVILTQMGPDLLSRLDDVDLEHAEDGRRVTV